MPRRHVPAPDFVLEASQCSASGGRPAPTAKLMVDRRNGARAVIRDTGSDAGLHLWSVLGAGEMRPVSEDRTDELARGESIAEAALRAYAENQVTLADGFDHSPCTDPEPALEAVACSLLARPFGAGLIPANYWSE